MVLTPRPKRKQPEGCALALVVAPLAGAIFFLTADGAFNLLEAFYWLSVMAAAFSGLLAIGNRGGNAAAWPIVVSAYLAAGLDWQGVAFDPALWRQLDLVTVLALVTIRIWQGSKVRASDWAIILLMLPAWWAYERDSYIAYVVTAAVVIVQCAVVVVAGARARVAVTAQEAR